MPVYNSIIGKPIKHTQPPPPDRRLFVKLDDMNDSQSEALWEAMKQHQRELAMMMARDDFIKDIRKQYGASFMMERTEVEALLNTQGMEYEDF